MKANIHPGYHKVIFLDTVSGFSFLSGSTKKSSETMKWNDGKEYPVIKMEVSSDTHPFYTGRQKFGETGGRAEKFMKKYKMK
ncbi:MAG: type B 50S ribosomal protein L31 [Bacillus sp. (in: firmicutes)]